MCPDVATVFGANGTAGASARAPCLVADLNGRANDVMPKVPGVARVHVFCRLLR